MSALEWPAARAVAAAAGIEAAAAWQRPAPVLLGDALGRVLAEPVLAATDLPPFDAAAMDGWAVAGGGPWRVTGRLLAGGEAMPLPMGAAVEIATGARLPPGAAAVLRREDGRVEGGVLQRAEVSPGADVRHRAGEGAAGERLLAPGTRVNPGVLGLAAAAGCDRLVVTRPPLVDLLIIGDELLQAGPSRGAGVRDALGPMLSPWVRALGATVSRLRHLPDTHGALATALEPAASGPVADVVVTTGSSALGPLDHLHPVLDGLGASYLVDGVRVRPGHPQVLARLGDARLVVGLPGNPLAAVSGVLTLLDPLLRALAGEAPAPLPRRVLDAVPAAHASDWRLVPVLGARPLPYAGPAMLRGLAGADALAVVPPSGPGGGQGTRGGSADVDGGEGGLEVLGLP